jgi:capsular exopolysaccharide synthesis family protein
MLSDREGRLRSIALTSAIPSEGKTTLSAHLAVANANNGRKTLIVDGDLHRPSIHSAFGLTLRDGLSNVLNGQLHWRDAIMEVEGIPNLSVLSSGAGSHRAADLIGPRLPGLLDEFAREYDLVILDSPPLLGFAECLQMCSATDGVLIVGRAASTQRKAVAAVVSALHRVRANIIGVVLNQVSDTTSAAYAQYGYQQYSRYGNSEE